MSKIGVVVIGRNEGERLVHCFNSIQEQITKDATIVYVDSGSTDRSCEVARERGIEVVDLDMSIPFTASRARNAGFERLCQVDPTVQYVQFMDGDSELIAGWIAVAIEAFENNPQVVATSGWRYERYPERSVYNRICDVEGRFGKIPGLIRSFEGNVVIRAEALAAVGGYNNNVIAAEDDELSVRLRQADGQLLLLDKDSVLHDADMHSVFQWWKRAKRTGYAYAQVSHLHGAPPERKFVREIRRTWIWGAIVPISALIFAPLTYGLSLILFARYPVTILRLFWQVRKHGLSWQHSMAWGISCSMAAFPGVIGATKFLSDRLTHKQPEIIEYKDPQPTRR